MRNDAATTFIRHVAKTLKREDFVVAVVDGHGVRWDVYNFTVPADAPEELRGDGMLAFRLAAGYVEIGFFERGRHHTEAEIVEVLTYSTAN
jgi:hypothetical protein